MLLKKGLCNTIIFLSLTTNASELPPRIARTLLDKKNVQKLYIAHGRSTILIFPCNVKAFSPGPTKDISAILNERDSKILEVWLSNNANQPSGLKVICNDNYFAFDVIPSNTTHQDFLEVKGSYGIPTMLSNVDIENKGTLVLSSKGASALSANKKLPKVIRIISSSTDSVNQTNGAKK